MNLIETVCQGYAACGLTPPSRVGVALSGGADSVALLLASRRLGFEVVPLHCNFHLRGAESDRDEAFVEALCRRLGLGDSFRKVDFDVEARMKATGESVEMACRSLRYRWFEQCAGELQLEAVAIGHHADDDAETLLLNLMRGTGLRGLCGIPRQRGRFIRPMIGCTRQEVLDFLSDAGEDYVTDSTNLTDDYTRNRIRHRVIPALTEANPNARKGMATTIANLRSDLSLLDYLIELYEQALTGPDGAIALGPIADDTMGPRLLFQILRRRWDGVTLRMATEILNASRHTGAVFHIPSGPTLLIDRGRVVADTPADEATEEYNFTISALLNGKTSLPPGLVASLVPAAELRPDRSGRTLWLSPSIINSATPLTLRHWRQGDRLEPFGMRGSRLISDIFSDASISLYRKKKIWLLEHDGKILWVIGMRASRHYPVTARDHEALKITASHI